MQYWSNPFPLPSLAPLHFPLGSVIVSSTQTQTKTANILCALTCKTGLYLTACEGVRPDVAFISLQLMSYRWYALNKTIKYPNVVFPGRSHWPDEHGYSLQKFFEANILERPIHVYGGASCAELTPTPQRP